MFGGGWRRNGSDGFRWILALLFGGIGLVPAGSTEPPFEAFTAAQDRFELLEVREDSILIRAEFAPLRENTLPLSLVFPEETEIDVEFSDGLAVEVYKREKPIEIGAEGPGVPDEHIQISRSWLGDIPLVHFRFMGIDRFRPTHHDGAPESQFTLKSATLTLRFEGSGFTAGATQTSYLGGSRVDPLVRAAGALVLNPTDIPRFRGLPRAFLEDETGLAETRRLGSPRSPSLRIVTLGGGICRISQASLPDKTGFPNGVPMDSLHLFHRGMPIPFAVDPPDAKTFDVDSSIWFHDPPSDNDQSDRNVYFLIADADLPPSPRIEAGTIASQDEGSAQGPPGQDWEFRTTRFEEDNPLLFEFVGDSGDIELYWKTLEAGRPFHLDFDLPLLAANAALSSATSTLRVRLDPGKPPLTAIRVQIDERSISDAKGMHPDSDGVQTLQFPTEVLRHRGNRLSLKLDSGPGGNGPPGLAPKIDWIEIRPPCTPREAGAGLDPSLAVEPLRVDLLEGSTLFGAPVEACDLIVVAAPRYFPQLEEYLEEIREKTGIASTLVSPESIYDAFNEGEKDFRAIKRYLAHALRTLPEPKPRHLWLVGESRWDPRNRLGSVVVDEVPTPPLKTEIGLAGNDQWYATLVGEDPFPDLLVARTSVSTERELENYLEKARTWRKPRPLGWWRATALELADRGFLYSVEEMFRRGLHREHFPRTLHLDDYPMDTIRKFEAIGKVGVEGRGARDEVVRLWNEGASMVEYLGHGGITVWSKEAMFLGLNRPDSDVDRLGETDRFPFVFIRSCLSGTVNWPIHPGEVSVSEALIRAPARGAAMVLSAVGTEQQPDQEQYARHFHQAWRDHGFRSPALLRLYAHCRSILQREAYLSVSNQFILHGDPTLEMESPDRLPELEFGIRGTRSDARLVASGRADFSGKGQVRLHNLREVLFESEVFEIGKGEIRKEFPLDLPILQIGETFACLYLWDESAGRDAFGARQVAIPSDPVRRAAVKLETESPDSTFPFAGGELAFQRPFLHSGEVQRGTIRLEAGPDLKKKMGYRMRPAGNPEVIGTIDPGGSTITMIALPFDRPGEQVLEIVASASDVAEASWTQRLRASVLLLEPPQANPGPLRIEPEKPVNGETVDFRLEVESIGSTTSTLTALDATLESPDGRMPARRLTLLNSERYTFPILLPRGKALPLGWRVGNDLPEGRFVFHWKVTADGRVLGASKEFTILPPPEVRTFALFTPPGATPADSEEPLRVEVEVGNVGGAKSDPLLLMGADTVASATFEGRVPPLEPGESTRVSVEVHHPGSLFEWIVAYRQLPDAIALRTRTGSQKFDLEVERSLKPESVEGESGTFALKAESREDFAPFRIRFFETTRAGLRPTEENRLRDFNPGELEFPDPSNVLSATQPALAALENPGVWWITPTRIETSPNRLAPPLRFLMPWNQPGAVGKIAPKFVKTPSYLGYPTPFLLLESEEENFELSFSSVGYEGMIPPREIEIKPPGLAWTLHNREGGWPTFSGFLFMALPEIRTPVVELEGVGPWSVSMEMEWIDTPAFDPVHQVRRRIGNGDWSAWEPLSEAPLEGDRIQVRCTFDPGGSKSGYSIRSVELKFSRN